MEQPFSLLGPGGERNIRTDPDARNARAAHVLDNFIGNTERYRHNAYSRNGQPSFLWPQQGRVLLRSSNQMQGLVEVNPDGGLMPIRGLYVSPGAFGKTALIAGAMDFAGVGNETPHGTIRGMVTTGSRFVPQTADKLARFLPHLNVTASHRDEVDMTGDIIVVGHGILTKHHENGTLRRQGIDLWGADEAHRLLGPQIYATATAIAREQHSWGFTATPDLANKQSAYNIFENEFYSAGNLEMIKAGHIQGVQLYGLLTRARIRPPKGGEDFTEEDLAPLVLDHERNAAIVSVALKMLEEGRKVVINCVEGGGSAHARLIADILNTQKVNGQLVKAVAAGNFMHTSKLSRVIKDVSDNKYDVYVQTYLGEESLDWPEVSGVIMARPTRSPRRGDQRAARGQRRGSGFEYTVMVEFFDQLEGSGGTTFQDAYTIWDVYGLSDCHQGQLVVSDEQMRRRTRRIIGRVGREPGFDIRSFSLQTQAELNRFRGAGFDTMVDHFAATVDAATIAKQTEKQTVGWLPMRPYCILLQARAGSKKPLNTASVLNILKCGGFGEEHTNVLDTTAGPRYEISIQAAVYLDSYEFPRRARDQDMPIRTFALGHGLSEPRAISLLEANGVPLAERRSQTGFSAPGRYVLAEHLDVANTVMHNRFTITTEEAQRRFVTLAALATRNGLTGTTGVTNLLAYYTDTAQPVQHWTPGHDGPIAHYPIEVGDVVDYHFSMPRVTSSQMIIDSLLDELGEHAGQFCRFLHEKGYIQDFSPARYLPRQKEKKTSDADGEPALSVSEPPRWIYSLQCLRAHARKCMREFMIEQAATDLKSPDTTVEPAIPEVTITSFEKVAVLAQECRCDRGATKYILDRILKDAHFSSITRKADEVFIKKFLANDFRKICSEVASARLFREEVSAYTIAVRINREHGQSLKACSITFTEASAWRLADSLGLTRWLRATDGRQPILTLFYPEKESWAIDEFVKNDLARRQALASPEPS